MRRNLTHLSDDVLSRELSEHVARERRSTATVLAYIAEFDARRLYVPAGYASMHAYCVEGLHLSDDSAYKRIQAARACRRFPALSGAVEEGRLHLAAVCLLAPHLKPENAEELIRVATHRRKSEIEEFLARQFPSKEIPAVVCSVRALPSRPSAQLAPGQVGIAVELVEGQLVLGRVG